MLPGDEVVSPADVVMDRAFTVPTPPAELWPWLVQVGKRRAGWYLPRTVERFVPPHRRALRHVDPTWQQPAVGQVVPDWGGRDATFTVAALEPPGADGVGHLLYTSERGSTRLTWVLVLRPDPRQAATTRLHLRLRLAPVKHVAVAERAGGFVDWLTVLGLAAGLRERVQDPPTG